MLYFDSERSHKQLQQKVILFNYFYYVFTDTFTWDLYFSYFVFNPNTQLVSQAISNILALLIKKH